MEIVAPFDWARTGSVCRAVADWSKEKEAATLEVARVERESEKMLVENALLRSELAGLQKKMAMMAAKDAPAKVTTPRFIIRIGGYISAMCANMGEPNENVAKKTLPRTPPQMQCCADECK